MSRFKAKTTEVSIYMDDDMFVTTVTKPDSKLTEDFGEAQVGDFHMSLFTAEEWADLSKLIEDAIKEVTK